MRVGAIGDQDIGQGHHLPRHIRMGIERDSQRQVRADHRPNPAQQLAFGIVAPFGHHRPVQFQVEAVERPLLQRIR